MASEAEASCESDPNFAIICAFLEKFGELCGIGSIDFVELQSMLENNLEVSPELMNLHIKLLRKTKKNVTIERWERALVNTCHNYSSKDAWEIERFGYKKTRLQVKLRALKEILEMQFDYNTKFKNEVNKMTAGSLRAQPLGRDKLGRAYWFQTDNNYQIRIYKEDPDEETWHLVAKDRDGLMSLMNELADGDSKLSSDSALNEEDSNSLSEKPFIDTGQSDNSNESKPKENIIGKLEDNANVDSESVVSKEVDKEATVADSEEKSEKEDCKDAELKEGKSQPEDVVTAPKNSVVENIEEDFSDEEAEEEEEETDVEEEEEEPETDGKEEDEDEVKMPVLRIKSLSELMEKPKESRKANFLPDFPELTITKKPKLDQSQTSITKEPKGQEFQEGIEVSSAIESPLMLIKGSGSGSDNKSSNVIVSEEIEESVMYISGSGSGKDCQGGNKKNSGRERTEPIKIIVSEEIEEPSMYIFGEGSGELCLAGNSSPKQNDEEIIVSEEIEEEVMYIIGEGSGRDCQTGNEKEQTTTQETDQSKNTDACTLQASKLNTSEAPNKVPIDSVNLDTIIESKTESEIQQEENVSPIKTQFFFGPGSLNIKPNPAINTGSPEDTPGKPDSSNGSLSEENMEKKEENGEHLETIEKDKETPEDSLGTEENKVPSSEYSESQDAEQKVNDNQAKGKNENDLEHEQIQEENSSFKQHVEKICEDGKPDADKDEEKTKNAEIEEKSNRENCETLKNESSSKEVGTSRADNQENVQQKTEAIGTESDIEESKQKEETIKETEENLPEDKVDESTKNEKKEDVEESGPESDGANVDEAFESEEPREEKHELQKNNSEDTTNKSDDEITQEEVEHSEVEEEKIDDAVKEETEVEEEGEEKSKEPTSKRKRVTRNKPTLNDSVTEEDMNPRKKQPVEKKKKGQPKVTEANDDGEKEKNVKIESSSTSELRATRLTRQTRSAAVTSKVQTPAAATTKAKEKLKKSTLKTSKSDEADSPAPLESVTIVDTDNSNTTADNPEIDPLAVSEEEMVSVEPTVPSITSFSFDYNPSSPVPEESKRSLRKRGRENLDNKTEELEKDVKRPKTKGKRMLDQTLRKSVEERRQQVGDGSSDENELPKKEVKAKGAKKPPVKKKIETPSVSDSDNVSEKSATKVKRGAKTTRLLKNLGVKEEDMSSIADSPAPVRQSRRIAQIKIKEEATRRRVDEDDGSSKKKKKKSDDKDYKAGKRKRIEEEVKPAPTPPMVEKKKKKKNKQNKISIGWKSSSEDGEYSCQDEEEVSEEEEHHEEEPLQFKSDHEFSPESDLECDDPLPLKRARTVRKEESDDDELDEEFPCQKCGKADHPEWILLCDKCDNGWHCSCLRPALFVIPEGDWYCPSCQHDTLMENLKKKLVEFDKMMVKKEMEDRRKERLAYVGISLNNVLPAKEKKYKKSPKSSESEESWENSPSPSGSEESDSDEPIYQLRQRRQAHSYKFQDYDDLINSALQEEPPQEVEKTHTLGRGKDIATIVNAAKEEEEKNGFEDLPPVVPRDPEESRKKAMSYRKKPKRLNNLEVNSDDEADDSDEDFKGSSSDESEEEEYTEDSDDSFVGKKGSRAVRRSTRARTTRYDADFINDDDSDNRSSKKKKKRYFSDSESSLSDDWRGKKKKSNKKSKKKKVFDDSDLENYRKKKPKVKYGMDSEGDTKGRRTRGKKTSYLDTLGSDSEEETLKKKIKDKSDDEYVAEDDSEEEAEVEKPSDEEEDDVNNKKRNTEESDSEEEALVVKKIKLKNKRAIMDSDEEEEVEDSVESPKQEVTNKECGKTEVEAKIPEEPKSAPRLPSDSHLSGLNVEKLKACGISVTKVAKDIGGESKLIEIGAKPILNQRSIPPVNLAKIDRNLDELDEEEVEEMMENEEYANRQLELAAIQIREAKRMKQELEKKEPLAILKKPSDIFPKRPSSGRFFNMKPPQESMLGGASLVMNDDDNDELSEPPGVTLPLFSELGSMKVHNLSKSNNRTPPPPMSPSRAVPVPLHGMSMGAPHPFSGNIPMVPPNPFGSPPGMIHQMRPNRPMLRGSNMPPMMGHRMPPMMDPRGPMPPMDPNHPSMGGNIPRNMNLPPMSSPMNNNIPMGTSAPLPMSSMAPSNANLPMSSSVSTGLNMTMGPNVGPSGGNAGSGPVHGTNPASSINDSPDGTPKKRRGRGKGKKTLAAEAAAAAAAAGLPPSEANKTGNNKPPVANIEIASPPQPFSQSQPAPSVITRMLQSTPGKGAFPVGRIRPKQFAMMQDSDDNESPRSAESQEKDMSPHPTPVAHPPVAHGNIPPGHYGPPPGQYPPNYYPKEGQQQTPHGYHHQRPPMHPYPPHHSQPPLEQAPMNPPINQPPIGIADPQYSGPPPPSKSPYEGMPPHRPPYPNPNPGYNYDYNVPPPVMGEEGVPPATYENPSAYPDQYESGSASLDPSAKNVEEEPSGEFGGLVSYFSSQHEDELEQ